MIMVLELDMKFGKDNFVFVLDIDVVEKWENVIIFC